MIYRYLGLEKTGVQTIYQAIKRKKSNVTNKHKLK